MNPTSPKVDWEAAFYDMTRQRDELDNQVVTLLYIAQGKTLLWPNWEKTKVEYLNQLWTQRYGD